MTTPTLPASFRPEVTKRAFVESAFDMGLAAERGETNPFVPDSPVHEAWTLGQSYKAMGEVIAITEKNIAALESAIVSDLNKGRYVILMDSSVIAACKRLPHGFNFSAMGADAETWPEDEAMHMAIALERETGRRMTTVAVHPFYMQALETARANLTFYREAIAK